MSRLWRQIIVGQTTLFALLVTSLLILFYSTEDTCPEGTFSCGTETSLCIPQRHVCDLHEHCPDGDDEDPALCADLQGSVDMVDSYINNSLQKGSDFQSYRNICEISDYPAFCRCGYKSRLDCKSSGLYGIPQNISSSVTHLILANNCISNITSDDFNKYNLQLIHLDGNGLEYLPPDVFRGQLRLEKLFIVNNKLKVIEKGVLSGLPKLSWLFLDNNQIEYIYLKDFRGLLSIRWINISGNKLTFENDEFPFMPMIQELFLNYNLIKTVDKNLFQNLVPLELLSLRGNMITSIHEAAFTNLNRLKELNLMDNKITILPSQVFSSLVSMSKLVIGNNPFTFVPSELFQNTINVRSLNMEGIEITNIDLGMFEHLSDLQSVYFLKYSYCSYSPMVPRCRPLSDGISSTKQLLYKPILRYSNWIICFITISANTLVLFGRYMFRDENKALSLVIRNLAISDLGMGIYLLIIAVQDWRFRNAYNQYAHAWISSWGCTVTGMIGMLSSEVSMLLLLFMSIDRYLLIAVPFGRYHALTLRKTTLILTGIWLVGVFITVLPVIEYHNSTRFYGVNGLCFPLHIDDPYFIGWEFSVTIFVGLNAFCMIVTTVVYIGMFVSIWRTRNATTLPSKDYEFAVRFFFIVLTELFCWLPIITIKVIVLFQFSVSDDTYGWLVVFILPINSGLNPILYTFTTPKYRREIYRVPMSVRESTSNKTRTYDKGSPEHGSMHLVDRTGLRFVNNKF
ncbi:relaxin receptor 2 isoform X2 [Aethina tumida]|uniref:relaxin receptor 2 isoform X2 n=1 Tax=Aethina tumida TaxID=116153 RepID=UPI00214916AC|nr:relaxin receptor 2 isoform X2 [Aethina tumida]